MMHKGNGNISKSEKLKEKVFCVCLSKKHKRIFSAWVGSGLNTIFESNKPGESKKQNFDVHKKFLNFDLDEQD